MADKHGDGMPLQDSATSPSVAVTRRGRAAGELDVTGRLPQITAHTLVI